MSYKVIDKDNNTLGESLTLGKAFGIIDDWCEKSNGVYGLGNIYHEYDNQIGIDVYEKSTNMCKHFHIIYD